MLHVRGGEQRRLSRAVIIGWPYLGSYCGAESAGKRAAAGPRGPALNRHRGAGRRAPLALRPPACGGEPSDSSTPGSSPPASPLSAPAGQAPSTASLDFQPEALYWFNQHRMCKSSPFVNTVSAWRAVSSVSTQTGFSGNGFMHLAFWCTDDATVLTNRNPFLCQTPITIF